LGPGFASAWLVRAVPREGLLKPERRHVDRSKTSPAGTAVCCPLARAYQAATRRRVLQPAWVLRATKPALPCCQQREMAARLGPSGPAWRDNRDLSVRDFLLFEEMGGGRLGESKTYLVTSFAADGAIRGQPNAGLGSPESSGRCERVCGRSMSTTLPRRPLSAAGRPADGGQAQPASRIWEFKIQGGL